MGGGGSKPENRHLGMPLASTYVKNVLYVFCYYTFMECINNIQIVLSEKRKQLALAYKCAKKRQYFEMKVRLEL